MKLFILHQEPTGSDVNGGYKAIRAEAIGDVSWQAFRSLCFDRLDSNSGAYEQAEADVARLLKLPALHAVGVAECPTMERLAVLAKQQSGE